MKSVGSFLGFFGLLPNGIFLHIIVSSAETESCRMTILVPAISGYYIALTLYKPDNIRQMYRDLVEYFIVREGNEHILTETADFSDTDTDWINDIA